mmetsp:Transcript_10194/g.22611  ORF Transcript_10194/g.22611 Transcript_10194/m.22611 type:complete len:235 (-) Transcript_10194:2225-2929(-)
MVNRWSICRQRTATTRASMDLLPPIWSKTSLQRRRMALLIRTPVSTAPNLLRKARNQPKTTEKTLCPRSTTPRWRRPPATSSPAWRNSAASPKAPSKSSSPSSAPSPPPPISTPWQIWKAASTTPRAPSTPSWTSCAKCNAARSIACPRRRWTSNVPSRMSISSWRSRARPWEIWRTRRRDSRRRRRTGFIRTTTCSLRKRWGRGSRTSSTAGCIPARSFAIGRSRRSMPASVF